MKMQLMQRQRAQRKVLRESSIVPKQIQVEDKSKAAQETLRTKVNGHQIEFQLDTGSDITLLNVDEWKLMGSPKLKGTSSTGLNKALEDYEYPIPIPEEDIFASLNGGTMFPRIDFSDTYLQE
ncbi:hypothetical protein ANCCEY_13969 [Ancylostoma ceylanicum]|uniref:Peptidase A2 domain-containing protein n=1 Tax=Ancylostoma ceylanicum TaxID=53326 RepID=A0A0D6L7M0_9BILA|nr:hypothetical protein ANCCEY_13969 [Ancylostoma ceylanicum]